MKSPPPPPPRTLAGRLLRWTVGTGSALLVAMFVTVLIEWLGMTFVWTEQGAARSAQVLASDLYYLTANAPARRPAGIPATGELAAAIAANLQYGLLVWTGFEAAVRYIARTSATLAQYLQAGLNAVKTFLIRIAIVVTALPLFLVFVGWGALEGAVRRDLRRFGGDIERGMIYHWAKHFAGAVVFVPIVAYLAWPGSINPAWVFMPFAVALSLNVMLITATFTKYV